MFSRERNLAAAERSAESDIAEVLRDSRLFDAAWYLETYPDVAASGTDPVRHYVVAGGAEGRNPNVVFDTAWYLATYADVAQAGMNPLLHYLEAGAAEGRSAGPLFDTAYYTAQYTDVADAGVNPLVHFLHHGRAEGRLAVPHDDGEAFEVAVSAKSQGLKGPAATMFNGPRGQRVRFPLRLRDPAQPGHALPLPPLRLAQRIGSVTLGDFDQSGRHIKDTIKRAMPADFDWNGSRILDFGCGVGRTLRHFAEEAETAEIWGCDIDGSSIRWAVENLSPPFRFFRISEVPTIPFEDNSFDLVYAISVLSHIHTTWQQWLMEIRRILKPGGVAFVSFMGQTPMEEMIGEPYWDRADDLGMLVEGPFHGWIDGGPMIFVSPDWIKTYWGSMLDIDFIAMDGLMDYQSFTLMRKPRIGAAIPSGVPVLRLGTSQPFDAAAVGRITPQFDDRQHFRDSYGLDLADAGRAVVEGWIAFRGGTARSLAASIDGIPVQASTMWTPAGPYRDWNCSRTAFATSLDVAEIAVGRHRFEAAIESDLGTVHRLSIPLRRR